MPECYPKSLVEALLFLADMDEQRRIWLGPGPEGSSPSEAINSIYDVRFAEFSAGHREEDPNLCMLGALLMQRLADFTDCDDPEGWMDAECVINHQKWLDIVRTAQAILGTKTFRDLIRQRDIGDANL